jgi:hypothetical protein
MMSDFFCPLCKTPTKFGVKEESFPFLNHYVTSYGWACPKCHWTELLSVEKGNKEEIDVPMPRIEGYTGEFRVRLAMFVQKAEENDFPSEAQEAIGKWTEQLKGVRAEERRIRKLVGLADHKPQTEIDKRFSVLLKRIDPK